MSDVVFAGIFGLLLAAAACSSEPATETGRDADVETDTSFASDASDASDDTEDDQVLIDAVEPPACSVMHRYDPLHATDLDLFPDDFLTRPAESPTGLLLDFSATKAPWVPNLPDILRGNFEGVESITGFARNGGIFMRFTGDIAAVPSLEESTTTEAIQLLDLSQDPPQRIPYTARFNELHRGFIVTPMTTLRAGALHALVVTDALTAADGGCVGRSAITDALLRGEAPDPLFDGLLERTTTFLGKGLVDADRIVALSLFTTHRDTDLMQTIAADIKTRTYAWSDTIDCVDHGAYRKCETSFVAWDYRDSEVVSTPAAAGSWTLPISVWLPANGTAPYPTVVIGHGMDQDRHIGDMIIDRLAPMGLAMISIDALHHGDHPTTDEDLTNDAMRFLGLDLVSLRVDGKVLRGAFEQSTLDRLQLMELLQQAQDIDGDGVDELDAHKLLYVGPSLGGMIGSGMLALRDDFSAAVFSVTGGNLTTLVLENALLAAMKPMIGNLAGSEARFDRLVTALQAVLDGADPATFGAHILYDRYDAASTPPHLLFNVAIADAIVAPAAGRALARALQIPHVGPVLDVLVNVPREEAMPVAGNLFGGTLTAGFFQFDRVTNGSEVREAEHQTLTLSPEGMEQEFHFIETWANGDLPEIVDPYQIMGTPPLPQTP